MKPHPASPGHAHRECRPHRQDWQENPWCAGWPPTWPCFFHSPSSKTSTSLALAVIYRPLRSLPVMSPAEPRKQMTETNTFTQEPALGELFLLPLYPKVSDGWGSGIARKTSLFQGGGWGFTGFNCKKMCSGAEHLANKDSAWV